MTLALVILLVLGLSVFAQNSAPFWRYEVFPDKAIDDSGSFNTSNVTTVCECKRRCFMLPKCKAWSAAPVDNEMECKLADQYPTTSMQSSSVFGVYIEGAPAYTTTTTTTTTPPTTTIDPTTYELRLFEDKECSKDRAISGVAVEPGAAEKTYLKYTICFKAKTDTSFSINTNDDQIVSTGPEIPAEACANNRVLIEFKSYMTYTSSYSRYSDEHSPNSNAKYMVGTCHAMEAWTVDRNDCVTETPNTESFPAHANLDSAITDTWDYWMKCSPFYIGVQVTRDSNNAIESLKCCKMKPKVMPDNKKKK